MMMLTILRRKDSGDIISSDRVPSRVGLGRMYWL